jgi:isopropylmalate/homocitrate/citramalate synthase
VPLVLKLTVSSVPAATFPLPDTVDCTTPWSAVTTSREVRAELVGAPISVTASTITPTATAAST